MTQPSSAPGSERRAVPRPQRVDPVAVAAAAGDLVLALAAFAVALSARHTAAFGWFVYRNGVIIGLIQQETEPFPCVCKVATSYLILPRPVSTVLY